MGRRVALVTSSYHPHLGGVESHVRNVARELRARGTDVEVWTVDRGERAAERVGVTGLDGIVVRHLPTPMPARSAAALTRFAVAAPRAWRAWRQAFRTFQPDVLHIQCFGPNGPYAAALARHTGTPLVLSAHGETFMDDHDVFGSSALMREGLRRAIASAAVTTGCSEQVLADLRGRFGLQGGVVVPNGVGPAPVFPAQGTTPKDVDLPDVPVVFGVGRLESSKGFDLLVEAVATMSGDPSPHLVIGGVGSQRDALISLGERLGLGERLRLLGPLDEAGVHAWMRRADVVVMPSRKEAFGIVALEAWRAGTPLVATTLGGPASFVTDGVDGFLVDPVNTAALAQTVESVLRDPALGTSIGAAGQAAALRYSWRAVAASYDAIYANLTPDQRRAGWRPRGRGRR